MQPSNISPITIKCMGVITTSVAQFLVYFWYILIFLLYFGIFFYILVYLVYTIFWYILYMRYHFLYILVYFGTFFGNFWYILIFSYKNLALKIKFRSLALQEDFFRNLLTFRTNKQQKLKIGENLY